MGARASIVITCDEPGCSNEYITDCDSADEAFKRAEGDHWRQQKHGGRWLDLCPDCKR